MSRKFEVLESVVLGFIVNNEQQDAVFKRGDVIYADGTSIWVLDATAHESTTMPHAIDVWLKGGKLREIPQ